MSIDLEQLAALEQAATPGPWAVEDLPWIAEGNDGGADAALIVAAVNALPVLLDEVSRLRAALSQESETARKLIVNSRDMRQRALDAEQAEREMSLENGRLLASQREHLVAAGIDPTELLVPLATPPNGTGYTSGYVQSLRAAREKAEAEVARLTAVVQGVREWVTKREAMQTIGVNRDCEELRGLLAGGTDTPKEAETNGDV